MKSKIYRDLTAKKLNQVTIDEIDTFRQGFYAQGRKNKRAYDELQQVAIASNQQGGSGSVPGTAIVVQTTGAYDNTVKLYQPTIGTWIVEAVSFTTSGGSGTYSISLELEDTVNGITMPLPQFGNVPYNSLDMEIDSNISLNATITGGTTPSSAIAYAYLMRRR
jgi:hypothetical protein